MRLRQAIGEEPKPGLKALLASAPLEGVDLTRGRPSRPGEVCDVMYRVV